MKHLRSNGKELVVRDCGPPIMRLTAAQRMPLPILDEVMSDDAARDKLRQLLGTGYYTKSEGTE